MKLDKVAAKERKGNKKEKSKERRNKITEQ